MSEKSSPEKKETLKLYNPWDNFSEFYDTYRKDIWYGAADNIETAWPPVLELVKKYFSKPKGIKALDFGCGAGRFCQELNDVGFSTTGIDLSPNLIAIGKQNIDLKIPLLVGDAARAQETAGQHGKFDLVVSIMVLEFIDDAQIRSLASVINKDGYLIFVNHNPLRLQEQGVTDHISFTDTTIQIPVHNRNSADYDNLLLGQGFVKVFEEYIKQSEEFLKKYNIQKVTKNPKYMVLAYQRNAI